MDCITVDSACNGELTSNGFVFAVKNAMCTEASHSYSCLATKGTCKVSNCNVEVAQGSVTGYKGEALMLTVAQEHVPIAIEAGLVIHDCMAWDRFRSQFQTSTQEKRLLEVYTAITDWVVILFWIAWFSTA